MLFELQVLLVIVREGFLFGRVLKSCSSSWANGEGGCFGSGECCGQVLAADF